MRALQYLSISMTLARLVMAIVASELIVREKHSGVVILLIILIIIFDIADGAIYRKSGKPDTGFRRILDSVADKVSMFSVAISALITVYPPQAIILAIVVELSISIISVIAWKRGIMIKPNKFGKITCILFAAICVTALYCDHAIVYPILALFVAFGIVTIASYLQQLDVLQKDGTE